MCNITPTKIEIAYAESPVSFSLRDCSLDKKYSFHKLEKTDAESLIYGLKKFERYTWRQLSGLSRENGLTPEKDGSESYGMIDSQNKSEQKMTGDKFYFHLRIEKNSKFRIFGYQNKHLFCITHIDPKGFIQH